MMIDEPKGRGSNPDSPRPPPFTLEIPDPVRVLVADDDPEMRALIASVLERAGYQVVQCRDGYQARHYVRGLANGLIRVVPEVVVTDHRMPGCTGLEVVEAMRGHGLVIPAILISGFSDPWLYERTASLGAALVLDKPFRLERLREEVSRFAPLVT